MLERINDRLRAEGVRPVEMIILKWRVSQLLRDIQRKFGRCKHTPSLYVRAQALNKATSCNVQLADCLAEGDILRAYPTYTQPESTSQQTYSPPRSESSPTDTRPYDPIRDV